MVCYILGIFPAVLELCQLRNRQKSLPMWLFDPRGGDTWETEHNKQVNTIATNNIFKNVLNGKQILILQFPIVEALEQRTRQWLFPFQSECNL
jgi:hypothetical protein